MQVMWRKVVAACDHSMPRRGHTRNKTSIYWWNSQFSVLCHECLTERRKLPHSKGDAVLHQAWKTAKSALRRGLMKSRLECYPWDQPLAKFKAERRFRERQYGPREGVLILTGMTKPVPGESCNTSIKNFAIFSSSKNSGTG